MNGPDTNARERILALVADQTAESSYDEILRELAFHRMIEHGLAGCREGDARRISTDEIRERLRTWHG